ncbi:hypothetical protein NA57DRAFT_38059 [Rhizodiscina lignyota]|uniref:RRM domain-containing protein n=1 Tax=Rhizodiscina lignyota TaxID=1504668 RepID=A0A9P4IH29_9PEZI|nr:hypothetical protein NA57DRAFT_38059 [Rhizodiscina lignyota]
MDINSLLSPQDSPANEATPNTSSPHLSPSKNSTRPTVQQRKSSGLSQEVTPDQITSLPSPSAQYFPRTTQQPSRSPLESRSPLLQHTNTQPPLSRNTSTPQMDTLADLAAMQHQQHSARQTAGTLHSPSITAAQVAAAQMATATRYAHFVKINLQSLVTLTDVEQLNKTSATIHDNTVNYGAHTQLIKLLHKGFLNHVRPEGPDADYVADAHTYELLADLRKAREDMDAIYPLGEDLWCEWINDEKGLARIMEERSSVVDLCIRATSDEPSSVKLWRLYGDYVYLLYATAHSLPDGEQNWSDEERMIAKERFPWTTVSRVWEEGVLKTQWRLNDSNMVWDRYIEILTSEHERGNPNVTYREHLQELYTTRLTQPHATWEKTFSNFSTFISKTANQEQWEAIMESTQKRASSAKQQWQIRDPFEIKISTCQDNPNARDDEWQAYSEYLDWEVKKKGIFSGHLIVGLFERAITRFFAEATLWEDYVSYLLEHNATPQEVIAVLERATRHCPWSGTLWSHRLLELEKDHRGFDEIEQVKHKATRTGILELASIEELLKVYNTWCGFLRRRAFEHETNSEDNYDIAEMGIRAALEHVEEVGEQLYGKDKFSGDPQYRLERIHIKFLMQGGDNDAARAIWKTLIDRHRDSYDFWYRWYIWEMMVWAKTTTGTSHQLMIQAPIQATSILKEALKHVDTMDFPEQLVVVLTHHCEQHEAVHEIQNAYILIRELTKKIQKRREQETAYYQQQEAAGAAEQTAGAADDADVTMANATTTAHTSAGKRKFSTGPDHETSKKIRIEAGQEQIEDDAIDDQSSQRARDRENTMIIATRLPHNSTSNDVRKFFSGFGEVVSIELIEDNEDGTMIALVEFETKSEAEYAVVNGTVKEFLGENIQIEDATGSTLWVTNYPPSFHNEEKIKGLFGQQGWKVLKVRLPSLKYNKNRRFCYAQFRNRETAQTAVKETDGTKPPSVGDWDKNLVVKVSDPNDALPRNRSIYEGRELYVHNLNFSMTEDDLRKLFAEFGKVESARIPAKRTNTGWTKNKSRGYGFVVFEKPEEAQEAIEVLNETECMGRTIKVEIASEGNRKRWASSVPPAAPATATDTNGHDDQDNEDVHMNGTEDKPAAEFEYSRETYRTVAERQLFLINIPDTVNDATLREWLEKWGTIKVLTLRPDHRGARVEYNSVSDAGRAEMEIPGEQKQFVEGQVVKVVDKPEFWKSKAEENGGGSGRSMMPATIIRRPAPRGGRGVGRGGHRGGLGVRRFVGERKEDAGEAGGKSNADFRDLVLGGGKKE